jgi:hypothetical protein
MGEVGQPISTLFLGFGVCAEAAARMLIRQGQPLLNLVVSTKVQQEATRASALGLVAHRHLHLSCLRNARRVVVDCASTEEALEYVRVARAASPRAQISATVQRMALRDTFLATGASEVVCFSALAAQLLANTVVGAAPEGQLLH